MHCFSPYATTPLGDIACANRQCSTLQVTPVSPRCSTSNSRWAAVQLIYVNAGGINCPHSPSKNHDGCCTAVMGHSAFQLVHPLC